MKAVIYNKNNKPEMLTLQEIEKPVPTEDQVLVKIHAASLNAYDYRSIQLGFTPKSKILGTDLAGVIEAIGAGVTKFKVGDAVFADLSGCGSGGFAEYVSAPEKFFALKPAGVSFEDAAAVPMAGLTALQGLRDLGMIQSGQKVLICGAGGGVGTFAVQLAKHFGAHVTAVCGTHNVELVRSLGAERVINYTKEDFSADRVRYDLVFAINGNRSLLTYKKCLAPKGIFVMAGGSYTQIFSSALFGSLLSTGTKKMRFLSAKLSVKDLEFIIGLVKEGKVRSVIDQRYPLAETAAAMKYLKAGHARGKVVINIV